MFKIAKSSALALLMAATAMAAETGGSLVTGVVRDGHGRAIKAQIAFDRAPLIFDKYCDPRGRFSITDVPAGVVRLVFSASGFQDQKVEIPIDRKPLVVVLEPGAGLEVTVLNSRGRPFEEAPVLAQREGDLVRHTCDIERPSAKCALLGIPGGRYRVSVVGHPNIPPQTVEVAPPNVVALTLRQPKGATLRVRVIDKTGENVGVFSPPILLPGKTSYPVDDAAFKAAEPMMLESDTGVRDGSARQHTFAGLAAGEYTILVPTPKCADNVSVSKTVLVPRGGVLAETVRLPFVYHECP